MLRVTGRSIVEGAAAAAPERERDERTGVWSEASGMSSAGSATRLGERAGSRARLRDERPRAA